MKKGGKSTPKGVFSMLLPTLRVIYMIGQSPMPVRMCQNMKTHRYRRQRLTIVESFLCVRLEGKIESNWSLGNDVKMAGSEEGKSVRRMFLG
jgi:hypothetical protein